ncbi:UNVERIFIED_CONTAM: hypothetical protein GTU68_043664 [Idotea baltica]|nr:hypothetical protein [Idotea baltica]
MKIHPTAVVEPGAQIEDDVEIGPLAIIGADVHLKKGCRIHSQAQIINSVKMGEHCEVHPGAIIGGHPQDLGFDRSIPSSVVIGRANVFREHVTIHRSTVENGETRIGDENYFMAGSHAGHDVVVGNGNIFANNCLLGGFVVVGNRSFLGGGSAIHQFVRVGDLAMVKGVSGISRDVPHYCTVADYNVINGLNAVGLRRAGFSVKTRSNIKKAFNHMFRSGLNISQALEKTEELAVENEVLEFVEFFRNPSRKGICTQ